MAAVMPVGSPGLDDEEAQSWDFVSAHQGSFARSSSGASNECSLPAPSPSMNSQGSWVKVTNNATAAGQRMRTLSTPSPLMPAQAHAVRVPPYSADTAFGAMPGHQIDGSNGPMFEFQHEQYATHAILQEQMAAYSQGFMYHQTPNDNLMMSDFNTDFDGMPMLPDAQYTTTLDQAASLFGIPSSMQDPANAPIWAPTGIQSDVFSSPDPYSTPPPRSIGSSSMSLSPRSSASPFVKAEPRGPLGKLSSSQSISSPKRPMGVQKNQKRKSQTSPRSSGSPSPDHNKFADGILMFCNQTVDNWGKGRGFGDMENIERSSQKGRKGALSEEVRANALRVRQTGACFCCHWRKVKCDNERPCKNCKKLCLQVPEVVCWKFQDFNNVLFPDFIRSHFKRDEMNKFIDSNVASFTIDGVEVPARVALSSGPSFGTKLVINAKFFTAKDASSDITQQWYQFTGPNGVVELEALRSAPIGLDINTDGVSSSQRNELRRKVEAYVDSLVSEPSYALQVTDSIHKTDIPQKVLLIVQQYAQASGSPIVRRALSIYAMHFVMTRHLTMTQQTIASLQAINPVAAAGPFLTPRLLNRQIKTVIDDVMQQEVNALFDDFTKRLKKKQRKEWAPCLAAFLVFTLLMESIETAADVYAITDNEIGIRKLQPAKFSRTEALDIINRIENLPFKQFAFQFHHLYQTHSRDASAKAFNPLTGEGLADLTELGPAALDLVLALKSLVQFEWSELDWLSCDPILPNDEGHPYPMNVEENYAGRLLSKFLLSFERPGYIFASA